MLTTLLLIWLALCHIAGIITWRAYHHTPFEDEQGRPQRTVE